jgi:hypothetical protein
VKKKNIIATSIAAAAIIIIIRIMIKEIDIDCYYTMLNIFRVKPVIINNRIIYITLLYKDYRNNNIFDFLLS